MNFEEPGFLGDRYKDESQTPPIKGWAGIEAGLDKGKQRKPFFWWLPVALLFTAPMLWFVAKDADKKPETAQDNNKPGNGQNPHSEPSTTSKMLKGKPEVAKANNTQKKALDSKPKTTSNNGHSEMAESSIKNNGGLAANQATKIGRQAKLGDKPTTSLSFADKKDHERQAPQGNEDDGNLATNLGRSQPTTTSSSASSGGGNSITNIQQTGKNAVSKGANRIISQVSMGNRKRPVRASNHVAEMKASADAAGNQPTSQPSTQSNPELSNNFLIDRNSADASRRARQTKQPEG